MEEILKLNDKLSRIYDAIRNVGFYQSNLDRCAKELSEVKSGVYLDAGCGTGNLFGYLANLGTVIGVDISKEMLKQAKSKIKNTGLDAHLIRADMAHLPLKENSLDGIISINVLHELPDPQLFIREAARVIKPDRNFVVSTPKGRGSGGFVVPFIKELTKDPRLIFYLPRFMYYFMINRKIDEIPTIYSYSKDELLNSLRREGFQITKVCTAYVQQNWLIVGRKIKK